jgi:hypothetical protein
MDVEREGGWVSRGLVRVQDLGCCRFAWTYGGWPCWRRAWEALRGSLLRSDGPGLSSLGQGTAAATGGELALEARRRCPGIRALRGLRVDWLQCGPCVARKMGKR